MFNKRTRALMESLNVTIEDVELNKEGSKNTGTEHADTASDTQVQHSVECKSSSSSNTVEDNKKMMLKRLLNERNLSPEQKSIIKHMKSLWDITEGRRTRGKRHVDYREIVGMSRLTCYTSTIEPKNIKEAIVDEYWI